MRAVANLLETTTSTVSQQLAILARENGAVLLEADGRGVRLTPDGRRLAAHASIILAAVAAAQADLNPDAAPAGILRVAGFSTAIRRTLIPIITDLSATHPQLEIVVSEHEPVEALALLDKGEIDLAITYDYSLAPSEFAPELTTSLIWSTPWSLGVQSSSVHILDKQTLSGNSSRTFAAFRHHNWIGNSRNTADEDVLRTIASLADFQPTIKHRSDSLDLVEDLVLAGMGVGLLPTDRPARDGITLLPLANPDVLLQAHAVTRNTRHLWAPLALLLQRLNVERYSHQAHPYELRSRSLGALPRLGKEADARH